MNFEQALIWMAFLATIGFIGYSFYIMIKEERSGKEKPGKKRKKKPTPKPALASNGYNTFVKANHSGTSIVSQVSDIRHSNVEVVNITNCPCNSERGSINREQNPASGIATADDLQGCDNHLDTRGNTFSRCTTAN
jgi:hypothetical protein